MPRYPVYVPSRGRVIFGRLPPLLVRDGVPFRLVVEPPEFDAYAARYGADRVIRLPFADAGSVVPARNFIKDHAIAAGFAWHWQIDDNIYAVLRWYRGRRIYVNAGVALRVVEEFADRYENLAIAGLNYDTFSRGDAPPFFLNDRVYSCTLVNNAIPHRWRGVYNEDADLCLQVLSAGWCTALINAFMVRKPETMAVRGGNTDAIYRGDGRLKMARALERLWPGVVKTDRRWHRPQHVIDWGRFRTPLRLRDGVDLAALPPNEFGMRLQQLAPIKTPSLRAWHAGVTAGDGDGESADD